MMNPPGNAAIGFLLLVGLVMAFGWPAAAIIGIPLLLDLVIGRVLLPLCRLPLRGGRTLQQKNITRATAGAFGLVVCAVLLVHGIIGPMLAAGLAAFPLLYLVVGIAGARSPGTVDPMSVFWWSLLVVIAGAALAFKFVGFPL